MMGAHDLAADLAARFGLDKRPRSWGGDCPACSYPRAFSVRVGKGNRPMLFCANGCTREALDKVARNAVGLVWTPPTRPDDTTVERRRAGRQAAALRLWAGSTPCAGTAAALYLAARGIGHALTSDALRYRGDCSHPEGGRLPAMVAGVLDVAGQPGLTHEIAQVAQPGLA